MSYEAKKSMRSDLRREISNTKSPFTLKTYFLQKKLCNNLVLTKKCHTFALAFKKEQRFLNKRKANGRLAQLVQSICLTSRGSAVRIRQRPQNEYGSVAQLNRASDYGSEGYRFESCRSHEVHLGRYQSGQMGQTVNLLAYAFGGSNPSLPTQIFP